MKTMRVSLPALGYLAVALAVMNIGVANAARGRALHQVGPTTQNVTGAIQAGAQNTTGMGTGTMGTGTTGTMGAGTGTTGTMGTGGNMTMGGVSGGMTGAGGAMTGGITGGGGAMTGGARGNVPMAGTGMTTGGNMTTGGTGMTTGGGLTTGGATGGLVTDGRVTDGMVTDGKAAAMAGNATADLILGAFRAANLLNASTVATIFAPSDDALRAVARTLNLTGTEPLLAAFTANSSINVSAQANATQRLVRDIVMLHVIPGPPLLYSSNITSTPINVTSMLGPKLSLVRPSPPGDVYEVSVVGSKERPAQIIKANVPYNSSVVHIINRVLLPPQAGGM